MRLAVLSDTHDNIWKLDDAIPHLASADAVLHCGDLCSPFVISQLGDGLGGRPLHVVWGNNDGDPFMIARVAGDYPNIVLHGQLAQVEIGGRSVAVNHYPEIALGLARSGRYDLVCYGHDHTAHQEWVGGCLLLNPGEVMGLNGRRTIATLDLDELEVEFVHL